MVFFIVAAGRSEKSAQQTFEALKFTGAQFIAFIPAPSDESAPQQADEGFVVQGHSTRLFPAGIVEQLKKSENIREIRALLSYRLHPENFRSGFVLTGFDPVDAEAVRSFGCSNSDILAGRLLQAGDTQKIMLEEPFARTHGLKTGQLYDIYGTRFEIIGILNPGTRPVRGDIYMPISEAGKIISQRQSSFDPGLANVLLVDGATSAQNQLAIDETKQALGPGATTSGYGCFTPASEAIANSRLWTVRLTFLVFFASCIIIAVMQFFAVAGRRSELGILKAIGWSDADIRRQLLFESAFYSIAGGIIGIVAAAAFAPVTLHIFGAGFIISIMTGAVAGFLSSLALLKIKPADALRSL